MNEQEIDEYEKTMMYGLRLPIHSQKEVDSLGLTDYVILDESENIFYKRDLTNPKYDENVNKRLKESAKKQFSTHCSLKYEYSEQLTQYVFDSIKRNVDTSTKYYYEPILKKAKLISIDKQSEIDYLKNILRNLANRISLIDIGLGDDELDFESNELDVVRVFLIDYIGIEGLIEFIKTKKIGKLFTYDLIKEAIENIINYRVLEKIKVSIKQLIESDNPITDKKEVDTYETPHTRIFINKTAFELFEYLKDTVKKEHTDFSFIYRSMHKDKFIYNGVLESEFREWLDEHYKIVLDKLKLYDYCKTPKKIDLYKTAKDLFKLNSSK